MKESTFGRLLIHLEIQEYGGLKIKDGTKIICGAVKVVMEKFI